MEKMTVIVAFGGISPEHEVSVLTAMQAIHTFDPEHFKTIPLYITKSGQWLTGPDLKKLEHYEQLEKINEIGVPCSFARNSYGKTVLKEQKSGFFQKTKEYPVDLVLVSFHGSDGENGAFQGVCETFNIPYTGCDVLSSAIGMNKVTAKMICRLNGISVVDDVHFNEAEWETGQNKIEKSIKELGYPVVVKPVNLGSSIGVSMVKDKGELRAAVELAFRYDEHLLVEKAVKPLMEINCSVLGDVSNAKASVCERPLGKEELLSFTDKYIGESGDMKGMASADRKIPADIPDSLSEQIRQTSLDIFKVFGASGVSRLDFLVNSDTNEFFFNEINTIPGSFSYYLWEASEVTFAQLLNRLIKQANKRHRKKNGRVQSYETNLLSEKAVKGLKGLKGEKNQ